MSDQKGGRYFDKFERDREENRLSQKAHDEAYQDKEAAREYVLERTYQLMDQEGLIDDNNKDTAYNDINVFLSFIEGNDDVAPQYKDESGDLSPIYKKIKDIYERDHSGEWVTDTNVMEIIPKADQRRGEQEPR